MQCTSIMKNSVKIILCILLLFVFVQAVQAAETYVFVTKWGTLGSGDGQFYHPIGIDIGPSGNVYVSDSDNNRIQKFSSDGTFLNVWGASGQGDSQFDYAADIVVGLSGNVFATDSDNNRIQKFSSDGTFLGKWGSSGTGDGQFSIPGGIAVDSAGNIYVADTGNNRIQKFSSDGTFLAKWGTQGNGDGQFYYPFGIAVDSMGNVFVTDTENHRVQKFSSSGTFITKWGTQGNGDGQFNNGRNHIFVDSHGGVYVADSNNNRIQKFDSDGTFISKWGSYGTGDGQFKYPTGITVDNTGNVYVADADNNRIQKFAPAQSLIAVSSITPSTAMNTSAVSITDLIGTGFMSGATVKLTKTGSPDITATGVSVVSPTKISCTFALTGKEAGQWNVVVTNPDGTSATLPHGFTIIPQPPQPVYLTGSWNIGGPDGVWGFGTCMALRQSQSQVTGNYTHEQGMVTGTVTGYTFSGVWAEAPTYTGEKDSGKFVVTISSDGNSFSGTFGYGNSSTGYAWNGTNSSTVCPVTDVKPLSVTAISPSAGTNNQSISATVTGTGFKPGAVVKLTLTGQPDIVASSVTLTGNATLSCTFDLTGKTTGTWDLAVTNPVDGTTSVRSTAFVIALVDIIPPKGTIIVSSTPPDALVYLDGSLKGTGSFTIQDVSPGYHSVRVSKTLYNDYGTDVRVVAGSPSYVNAVLTPVTGTSGTISASSNPAGASVYLDGMDKGISPVTITGVSSGLHTVSFTKTGYTAASRSVTMTAGQTTDITVDLTKTGGDLGDLLNTTTLIIVGIVVLIIIIIGVLLRKKKNRWDNY